MCALLLDFSPLFVPGPTEGPAVSTVALSPSFSLDSLQLRNFSGRSSVSVSPLVLPLSLLSLLQPSLVVDLVLFASSNTSIETRCPPQTRKTSPSWAAEFGSYTVLVVTFLGLSLFI
jgi:hypothetical protein